MKTGSVRARRFGALLLAILLLPAINACVSQKSRLEQNIGENIRYETGANDQAAALSAFLPVSIQQVEAGHGQSFKQEPLIYVFATDAKFEEVTGYNAGLVAGVSTPVGVFLSPQASEPLRRTLTHELSHVLLRQWVGSYRFHRTPVWFVEGLATWAAKGGGADSVSVEQAELAIGAAQTFSPNLVEGAIFRKGAPHWHLSHHMFYRQSSLFVAFLAAEHTRSWRELLELVHNGNPFRNAWASAFGTGLDALWASFIRSIVSS